MAQRLTVLLFCLFVLAACQTTGGTFCQTAKPIRLNSATIATMTDGQVRRALAQNKKGARLCGWKTRGK